MSEIHIQLAGVQLGPYSEDQVRQHLEEGLLSPMDQARIGNEGDWYPLSHVLASIAGGGPGAFVEDEAQAPSDEAETVRPQAPPPAAGVTHLPTRPEPEQLAPTGNVGLNARKTVLIEPRAPRGPVVGGRRNSASVTSPLAPKAATKKVSRDSLLNALAQKTAPMGESPPEVAEAKAPPTASGSTTATTTPLPTSPDLKRPPAALARALSAKTAPMRPGPATAAAPAPPSSSLSPVSPNTTAVTTPMSSRPALRHVPEAPATPENIVPPASTVAPTKKMERGKSAPPVDPDTAGEKTTLLPRKEKLVEPDAPGARVENGSENVEEEMEETPPRGPARRSLAGFILFAAILAVGAVYYVWSPYHAAAQLRNALSDGNPTELDAAIDFPLVRDALKQQVAAQIAPTDGTSASASIAMLDHSIDLYLTPDGIAGLVKESAAQDDPNAVSTATASRMLVTLNTAPVRAQGLASLDDFVIDLGVAVLHLKFHGVGWDLKRVDLGSDLQSSSGAPVVLAPVVATYLERGNDQMKNGALDAAIAAFTDVLTIDPQSSEAYSDRGSARQAKGDIDGAIKDYTQAITLDPNLAAAYDGRGNARNTKGDLDGAVADYTKAIELDPKMAVAYDSRGNVKTAKEDLDGAIADYTEAISIDPTLASAYSDRGFARQANGNLDGAIGDYTEALALDPKRSMAYFNRGLARQSQGNLEAAIVDFDRALAFDPKLAVAYLSRGNAKLANHDLDGAISDYTQAIALNPKIAQAFSSRGMARQAKGDVDGAITDYTQSLALDPKNALAYFERSVLREKKGDADGAIADSSQAIDLDPKNAQAYYNRALAKLVRGNLEGALTDLKQFSDLAPTDRQVDMARIYSWVASKADNAKVDADQDLIDAVQNNWNSPPDDFVTRTANFILGRMTESDYLASASEANADPAQSGEASYFAGMKRLLAGDTAGALDAFHKSAAAGSGDEALLAQSEIQLLSPAAAQAPAPVALPLLPGPAPVPSAPSAATR